MLFERQVDMIEHIGQQLGHYRLIRKLGSGGFADVYQAEHIHLNTLVAIKLLNANLADGDLQNFRDEARIIARLIHPHIVRVLDFGVEQAIPPYLVMEYAPNGTLRQRHPKGTRVPLSFVVAYVKQIASALYYAHSQRLIHRDVKPENLLLGQNDEVLLSDFGAALITRTSLVLTTQNIIGTASYMAPEQLQGKPTFATDQYALATVVYEWLCGHCPFQGSLTELHNLQLSAHPPSLLAGVPTLPPAVEQVIMKALAKRPEQRFNSIEEFASVLEMASIHRTMPPLHLPGDAFAYGQATLQATEMVYASQLPSALPATPLPETILAIPPVEESKHSRRIFLGSLMGLAVVGGGGLAWWFKQNNNSTSAAKNSRPSPSPTPTALVIKSNAYYSRTSPNEIFTAAWSPEDKYIAFAGGDISSCQKQDQPCIRKGDTGIYVWDINMNKDITTYMGHNGLVRMVAWSPDGARIASASEDKTVQVWDAITGNNLHTYTGHTDKVIAVAWSNNGAYIASASADKTVQVWDAITGDNLRTYTGHTNQVTSVAWSHDDKLIASASYDKTARIWDANAGTTQHILFHSAIVGSLAWSPNGRYIATSDYNNDDSVRLWNSSTGDNEATFLAKPTKPNRFGNPLYTVSWSPDSNYIAVGGDDGEVKIWRIVAGKQIAGRQVLTYQGHKAAIMSTQWSHNGKNIASCGFDKTVQLWTVPLN